MAKPNYDIDYNDKRFQTVETEKKAALSENDKTYGGMISNSDKYYQKQIDAVKGYEKTQTKLQNEQTDFAIEKIEQQKAQAKKDYTKEQSGAYTDWQKQSNAYGVNAEKQAAAGMQNSGYSESSQVSMYNTYQNRVAMARDAYQRALLNYNNSITEARLQNNAALAKIAFDSLQQQLELSLQGFQYKNTLVLEQAKTKREIQQIYHSRYQDVLKQINTENALAEEVRQYNETLAEEKRQYNATLAEQKRQHNEEMAYKQAQFAWQKAQASKSISGGGSGGSGGSKGSSGGSSSSKKKKGAKSAGKDSSSIRESKSSKKTSSKKSSSSSKGPTVDMQSVLNLGYGPISANKLNTLVKQGKVEEYQEGNKLKYRKKFNW